MLPVPGRGGTKKLAKAKAAEEAFKYLDRNGGKFLPSQSTKTRSPKKSPKKVEKAPSVKPATLQQASQFQSSDEKK